MGYGHDDVPHSCVAHRIAKLQNSCRPRVFYLVRFRYTRIWIANVKVSEGRPTTWLINGNDSARWSASVVQPLAYYALLLVVVRVVVHDVVHV